MAPVIFSRYFRGFFSVGSHGVKYGNILSFFLSYLHFHLNISFHQPTFLFVSNQISNPCPTCALTVTRVCLSATIITNQVQLFSLFLRTLSRPALLFLPQTNCLLLRFILSNLACRVPKHLLVLFFFLNRYKFIHSVAISHPPLPLPGLIRSLIYRAQQTSLKAEIE